MDPDSEPSIFLDSIESESFGSVDRVRHSMLRNIKSWPLVCWGG